MKINTTIILLTLVVNVMFISSAAAQQTGTPIYGSTNPAEFKEYSSLHKGAGTVRGGGLFTSEVFKTNFSGVSRAHIPPGASIGEHLHRHVEEVFIILNAPAQFTVNGKTAELPARSMVVCNLNNSHGIYNHNADTDLDWLFFAVTDVKGNGDSINFGEDLTNKKIESPAPFKFTTLDRSLLHPMPNAHGGKGAILFRRMWDREDFLTNWEFIDHCVLPPGTSIGYHQHNKTEEVYYIVSGAGRMTVNNHTWEVKADDAIPCTLHDSHGLYNNGTEDIELIVCSFAEEKGARDIKNWGDDLTNR